MNWLPVAKAPFNLLRRHSSPREACSIRAIELKPGISIEMPPVAAQQDEVVVDGSGGNEQILIGDELPDAAKFGTNTAEHLTDRLRKRHQIELIQKLAIRGERKVCLRKAMGALEELGVRL
jgi:hypothetical protein